MEGSTSDPQLSPQSNLYLSKGLSGQDDRFDYLTRLFEELQLATVETCNPHLDMATFAEDAYYFAVIMKSKNLKQEKELNDSPSLKYQVRASDGNVSSTEEGSKACYILRPSFERRTDGSSFSQAFFKQKRMWGYVGYPKAQTMKIKNEWRMGSSYKFPDPFVEAANNPQQTSQNFRSDFKTVQLPSIADLIDFPLDDPSPSESNMEEYSVDTSMSRDEAIGLVYLANPASSTGNHLHDRELNIGIILAPSHRGQGYAHQAIEMVLEVAFEIEKCHRVQAILPDHVAKDSAICLFTQMRFDHEGTRRRAFFSRMEDVYKDVTYLGILDTDWMLHQTDRKRAHKFGRPAPRSVWDELLSRHQREREELLCWEAGIRPFERLQARSRTPTQSCFRTAEVKNDDDEMDIEITLDAASTREPVDEEIKSKTSPRGQENDPFETSTESDDISECSANPDGYFSATSSSASGWDVVEPSDFDPLSSSSSDSGDFEFVRSP
ncbi:hypothetical protein C0993_001232 [Termitomyces sp. T159_Od127]|nr:hypothetical protein C0993_001232 [Termitomyces sp. T159_Od127]